MSGPREWYVEESVDGLMCASIEDKEDMLRRARVPHVARIHGPFPTLPDAMVNISQNQVAQYVEWRVMLAGDNDPLETVMEVAVGQDMVEETLGHKLRVREILTKRINGNAQGRAVFHIVKGGDNATSNNN